MGESTTELTKEAMSALAYLVGFVTGLIILFTQRDPEVRFHAIQSIILSVLAIGIHGILSVTVIFSFVLPFVFLIEFSLWLVLMYTASQGKSFTVPFVTPFARKLFH